MRYFKNYIWNKINKLNTWLILPFALLSTILVIIPLIIVFVFAFNNIDDNGVGQNFVILNNSTGWALWRSLWLSVCATALCLLIGCPFAYFLSFSKSKSFKAVVLVIITAPIWSSFLIKLIGLKSLLDILNGGTNTTFGAVYTLIGLVYLYLPFAIMPIYTIFDQTPRNIIFASQDLGHNSFMTFVQVVLPFAFSGIMSAIVLVILPSFTTVAVGQFLDNSNSSFLIGDLSYEQGILGLDSKVSLARTSVLSLVISIVMGFVYGLIVFVPKLCSVLMAQNKALACEKQFKFFYSCYLKLKNNYSKNLAVVDQKIGGTHA